MFANELSDRLKVIACIEKPNMIHSEQIDISTKNVNFQAIRSTLQSGKDDAFLLIWGPEEDIPTALDTIEERCRMAFAGVPNESRKSFRDGTTIFERVLPGADRMYPDTDSPPIPIDDKEIKHFSKKLPIEIHKRYTQLIKWNFPIDIYDYILRNNLSPLLEKIFKNLDIDPKFIGTLFGHTLKHHEGQIEPSPDFEYERVYDLLLFLRKNNLDFEISKNFIPQIYRHPNKDFDSILKTLKFKKTSRPNILSKIPDLNKKYNQVYVSKNAYARVDWIMGKLRPSALGNMDLKTLREIVENKEFSSHQKIQA